MKNLSMKNLFWEMHNNNKTKSENTMILRVQ